MLEDAVAGQGALVAPVQHAAGSAFTFYRLSDHYCYRIEITATYSKQTTAARPDRSSERPSCCNISRFPAILKNVGSVMSHRQISFSCPSRCATLSEGGKVSSGIKKLEGTHRIPSRFSALTEPRS